MKLNIEELAREAGAGYGHITEEIMERFARLIVERCAQEADNNWDKQIADAIRNLMED